MTRTKYILEGLNCSNCASKIEQRLIEEGRFNDVKIDLINMRLFVKSNDSNSINSRQYIQSVVDSIEKDVKVINEKEEIKVDNKIKDNIFHLIGIILFIISYFLKTNIYIYSISYLLLGYNVIIKAFKNVLSGNYFDENFLMSIATIGAFIIGEYKEAVAVMLFYNVGEFFQNIAVESSRKSIEKANAIRPNICTKKVFDKEILVSPNDVKIGDIIIVKPGEMVALDGEVVKGQAYLDTSAINGEFNRTSISKGDSVISGTIVEDSSIEIKVNVLQNDSTISRVVDLIEEASLHKTPTIRFITKFAKIYTPVVIIMAIIIALIPIVYSGVGFDKSIYRALIFLVISCPCALVLSVPLSYFMSIGRNSKSGIYLKSGEVIENLSKLKIAVFDKTGTLTKGELIVDSIISSNEDYYNKIAASILINSNHPVARAVVRYIKYPDYFKVKDFKENRGLGVEGIVDGIKYYIGSRKYAEGKLDIINKDASLYLFSDKIYAYYNLSDNIRKSALDTIKKLGEMSIPSLMLTGDSESNALKISRELGLKEFKSSLMPEDKLNELLKIKKDKTVLFVGDGINDAPVLKAADIGVSLGTIGSDIALEASDMVIMNDDLSKIIESIDISKFTIFILKQNIIFILFTKVLFLIMGAFGFASMWMAIFADVGVTIIAVLNSIRIFSKK